MSTERINGAVATSITLDSAIQCGVDYGGSVYDLRGIIFVVGLWYQPMMEITCWSSLKIITKLKNAGQKPGVFQ